MRWMLRVLRRLGLGLSTILFVATLVLWVRSWENWEGWTFVRFEPRPDWKAPELAGEGIERRWSVAVIHCRLWLRLRTWAPEAEFKTWIKHQRQPTTADEARQDFDFFSHLRDGPWEGGTQRAWHFAGAGFRHYRRTADSRIGRPSNEEFDLALPFWMLAVAFGLWPGVAVGRRLLRRKRHAPGHCPACGYDLRATPDRCPECGRVTSQP